MTKMETIDRQNREIESQGLTPEDGLTDLELSLDELSYVSGGIFVFHPIKPWYCGQE